MRFAEELTPDIKAAARSLGYEKNTTLDTETMAEMQALAADVINAAQPRWCSKSFGLLAGNVVEGTGWQLRGNDICLHLARCTRVVLLGVTLGAGVDALLRAAAAADVRRNVLLDTLASELIEQYADLAQAALHKEVEGSGYLTGRFSPGYGDMPLESQKEMVRLVDAPRAIGLTVGQEGMLLPTKSITAFLGFSTQPVTGRLAGCETCALNGKCARQQKGEYCGKANI